MAPHPLVLIAALFTFMYLPVIFWLRAGLNRLTRKETAHEPFVSIIVPARNERDSIGNCLASLLALEYPKNKYEIIVVNDNSTDDTADIVSSYGVRNLTLVDYTPDHRTLSPKKGALRAGIEKAKGSFIFSTDADCVAPRYWLSALLAHFTPATQMVAGLVCIHPSHERTLFDKLQSLEFTGIVAAGAACFGAGSPQIANAANLAYRREAFLGVCRDAEETQWVSGDDALFMQILVRRDPSGVDFCVSRESIVYTQPQRTLGAFLQQRRRWASKIKGFSSMPAKCLLCAAYGYYLVLAVSAACAIVRPHLLPAIFALFTLKCLADAVLLRKACAMLQRYDLLKYLPLTELFHIGYLLLVGPLSLTRRFTWKGRNYNKYGPVRNP